MRMLFYAFSVKTNKDYVGIVSTPILGYLPIFIDAAFRYEPFCQYGIYSA